MKHRLNILIPEMEKPLKVGQWQSLEIYLQDAQIEIDNMVENAIRPTALGKKNWLFFGDANAGERSAVIYSIIESCRRNGVEAYTPTLTSAMSSPACLP
jgi:hypothetical protein